MDIAAMEACTYREEARWGRAGGGESAGGVLLVAWSKRVWNLVAAGLADLATSARSARHLLPFAGLGCSVPDTDWAGLLAARSRSSGSGSSGSGGAFQAVLINTGWECEGRRDAAVQVCCCWPMCTALLCRLAGRLAAGWSCLSASRGPVQPRPHPCLTSRCLPAAAGAAAHAAPGAARLCVHLGAQAARAGGVPPGALREATQGGRGQAPALCPPRCCELHALCPARHALPHSTHLSCHQTLACPPMLPHPPCRCGPGATATSRT